MEGLLNQLPYHVRHAHILLYISMICKNHHDSS